MKVGWIWKHITSDASRTPAGIATCQGPGQLRQLDIVARQKRRQAGVLSIISIVEVDMNITSPKRFHHRRPPKSGLSIACPDSDPRLPCAMTPACISSTDPSSVEVSGHCPSSMVTNSRLCLGSKPTSLRRRYDWQTSLRHVHNHDQARVQLSVSMRATHCIHHSDRPMVV